MTKPQRNAPCPCGSGRKHKHCCGNTADASDLTRARNLRCEIELGRNALEWSARKHGREQIEAAWQEFSLGVLSFPLHALDEVAPFSALFFPWWLYGGSVRAQGSRAPIAQYLKASHASQGSLERRIAEAVAAAPFSLHRVVDVDVGHSMELEDIFTRQRLVVLERAGAVTHVRSAYMYARLATVDGIGGIYGNGPFAVEPSWFLQIKALRDSLEEQAGRTLTVDDLHEFAIEIRQLYLTIADSILNPLPPQLTNTDGDPLVPTRLVYDLACDCEHAFDKLWTLAKGHERSGLLDEAQRDAAGRLARVSIPWIDSRKSGRGGMGPVILGDLRIAAGRLEIEVNSSERADRIRPRIERRLGKRATFRHALIESMEEMLRERVEASSDAPHEPDLDSPELQDALAEIMKRHRAAWFDEPIPALEGRTPRQAARSAEGRELLEALLADYDRSSREHPGDPLRPDTAELRRVLGID